MKNAKHKALTKELKKAGKRDFEFEEEGKMHDKKKGGERFNKVIGRKKGLDN